MNAASSTVSKETPLVYALSINTAHTPSLVYSFNLYPPVHDPIIFTYVKSDPPSPPHDS